MGAVERMSRNENTAVDTKKLVLRYKALEAQLRNSIPEKQHNEAVSELEEKNAEQEKELMRTKTELQKASAFSKQIAVVGEQVAGLSKTIGAQGKTIDSLAGRISQGTVPASVHQQSLSKINGLEERMRGMVIKSEYSEMEKRYEEVTRQMSGMVPSSDNDALKERVEELENMVSSMVPKEQFVSSESKVKELEARLAEHVPQNVYEELVSKVVQLAEEATGGPPAFEKQETTPQVEPLESKLAAPVDSGPVQTSAEASSQPVFVSENAGAVAVSEGPAPNVAADDESTPEIREVGSQLAEISASEATEAKPAASSSESEPLLVKQEATTQSRPTQSSAD